MTKTGDDRGQISVDEYLRLLFSDPLSLLGIGLMIVGSLLIALTPVATGSSSWGRYGMYTLIGGTIVFALGYTRTQHQIKALRESREAAVERERGHQNGDSNDRNGE